MGRRPKGCYHSPHATHGVTFQTARVAPMLRWRLFLGTLLIAALGILCWLDGMAPIPGLWLFPVALVFVIAATNEVLYLAALAGGRPLASTVYTGNILLLVSSWVPIFWARAADALPSAPSGTWPLLALALGVPLVFTGEMYRFQKAGNGATMNVGIGVFTIVYVGLLVSLLAQLRIQWGIWALVSLLVVVKLGDVGAFTVGRLLGRHKIAPTLSPGKTVEGAVGALVFACAGSWVTFQWLIPWTTSAPENPSPWWGWILFGLLVGTAGMVGDLAESLMKRDAGAKDSSHWMPGFGGVLDLLDSVLLAAPVGWLCWALGVVGY